MDSIDSRCSDDEDEDEILWSRFWRDQTANHERSDDIFFFCGLEAVQKGTYIVVFYQMVGSLREVNIGWKDRRYHEEVIILYDLRYR
jgi:hypothetical protein